MELPNQVTQGRYRKRRRHLGLECGFFPPKKEGKMPLFACFAAHTYRYTIHRQLTMEFLPFSSSSPFQFFSISREKTHFCFAPIFSPFEEKLKKSRRIELVLFFYKRTFKCLQKHKAEIGPFFAKNMKRRGRKQKNLFWQLKEKGGKKGCLTDRESISQCGGKGIVAQPPG